MNSWPDTQYSLIGRLGDAEDASAWEFFQDCYQSTIYRLARARGLQPDEARDVVQEVMLAVHRQAMQWKPSGHRGSFRAWLAETTRRQAFASLRFRAKNGRSLIEIDEPTIHESHASDRDTQDWLFYRAVAMVERETSPEHWQAFWCMAIEGLDPKTVADRFGLRLGTAYSIKSRVLARIKSCISQYACEASSEVES